jgi:hypothetical protein
METVDLGATVVSSGKLAELKTLLANMKSKVKPWAADFFAKKSTPASTSDALLRVQSNVGARKRGLCC